MWGSTKRRSITAPAAGIDRACSTPPRNAAVGTASDLLRAATSLAGDDISKKGADWPKHPGALAGRLRRAQTFVLGGYLTFSREGRAGTRTIRISSGGVF